MKLYSKSLAAAGIALAAIATTVPATAQVQGKVGTSSISRAILSTNALQNAFAQVSTTYQAQIQTAQTKQTELNNLLRPLDTNGNGNIDESESAGLQASPNFTQIQTLRGEIAGIENQVTAAQVYAVEQVLVQYQAAMREVATQQQIVMVVDPKSLQFAAEGTDITALITTSLNAKVPSVTIVPPENWRPSPNSVQIFEEIQQRVLIEQVRRQQAAAAQQQPQGNTQAPQGR